MPSTSPSDNRTTDGITTKHASDQCSGEAVLRLNADAEKNGATVAREQPANTFVKNRDFWIIISVMCLASFTSALDTTIIITALPQVAASIGGEQEYVWIANSFVLAGTVFQPLFGQLSNIFGRRWPYIFAMGTFILGSGISGGSHTVKEMIAGRVVQGIGSAGLFVLSDIIVCDLVPLRERAKYIGLVLSTAAIGTIAGPIIGGIISQTNWRWCFYINLPLGIPCLVLLAIFLGRLHYQREPTWAAALKRVDYAGNLIFIPSITALLLGLIMGGRVFPWSSWQVILPIAVGVGGWAGFHVYESLPVCKEPSVPPHLFRSRTTCSALAMAFLAGMLLNWTGFFIPFYFQAVKSASPLLSGVYTLPMFLFIIPASIVAGGILSKIGRYRPLHWAGFALLTTGLGLLSMLDADSHTAEWVFYQIIAALGLGPVMTTLLPAVLASLTEADVASGTSAFSFLRSFGMVWGITVPSIVFNNEFNSRLDDIGDSSLRPILANGRAFGYVQSGLWRDLSVGVRDNLNDVYARCLSYVWYASVAFALLGLVLAFVEKDVELRSELETDFGIREEAQAAHTDGNH